MHEIFPRGHTNNGRESVVVGTCLDAHLRTITNATARHNTMSAPRTVPTIVVFLMVATNDPEKM